MGAKPLGGEVHSQEPFNPSPPPSLAQACALALTLDQYACSSDYYDIVCKESVRVQNSLITNLTSRSLSLKTVLDSCDF